MTILCICIQLQLVLGHDLTNIIETFNISHTTVVENLSDIFFIPKLFNPRIEEKKATTKARRSSEMRGATNTVSIHYINRHNLFSSDTCIVIPRLAVFFLLCCLQLYHIVHDYGNIL